MSKVEAKIKDSNFLYEQPWFYNNKLSLRCELGIGCESIYYKNAFKRALKIFNILFDEIRPNCVFYDYYLCKDCDNDSLIKISNEVIKLNIENLSDEDIEDLLSIDRYINYDINTLDFDKLIKKQLTYNKEYTLHFVSFENEFIFSIYDDRGCDVIFFDEEKYKEFYIKLEKYFLDYDKERMKSTFNSLL